MTLDILLESIRKDGNCRVFPPKNSIHLQKNIPDDLKQFYQLTDGISLFEDKSYNVSIVGRGDFIPINKKLFLFESEDQEERDKNEVSSAWFLIAKNESLDQYISIDLTKERFGQCYDSFSETHSLVGNSQIIAKNFTQLLNMLYKSGGENWFWLGENFEYLGDAYDAPII